MIMEFSVYKLHSRVSVECHNNNKKIPVGENNQTNCVSNQAQYRENC